MSRRRKVNNLINLINLNLKPDSRHYDVNGSHRDRKPYIVSANEIKTTECDVTASGSYE